METSVPTTPSAAPRAGDAAGAPQPVAIEDRRFRHVTRVANAVAAAIAVGVAVRYVNLVNRYSVNVPAWDHWDYFFTALWYQATAWDRFVWQHGPHRMGIAFVVSGYLARATHWNIRAEAFHVAVVTLLAAIAALGLKWRLSGRLAWYDVVLPLMILTPVQWETFAGTADPSHGAVPLLLVLLYAWAWTARRPAVRYPLLLGLNFLAVFTGFGLFLGAVTVGLLCLQLPALLLRRRWGLGAVTAVSLGLAAATLAFFFYGYHFDPAAPGFKFPDPRWYLYPHVMALAFTLDCGLYGTGPVPAAAGGLVLMASIAVVARRLPAALRPEALGPGETPDRDAATVGTSVAIVVLIGFSLLFAADMAVGRLCIGVDAAQASRYVPLLTPAMIGLWLHACALPAGRRRNLAVAAGVALAMFAGLRVKHHDRVWMRWYCEGKLRWVQAYRETQSVYLSDQASGISVYPDAAATHLDDKLAYVRDHAWSFYHDRTWPPQPRQPVRLPTSDRGP